MRLSENYWPRITRIYTDMGVFAFLREEGGGEADGRSPSGSGQMTYALCGSLRRYAPAPSRREL